MQKENEGKSEEGQPDKNSIKIKWNAGLLISFTAIVFFTIPAFSQFYTTGEDPASIHWQQINTSSFRVVFPNGFENEATRLTNLLSLSDSFISGSLKQHPKRVTVLIHNQTVNSNGYVALAPRRMELFTLPPQDIYAQDWLEQLSLHELRHVVQMDKLNHGFTRALSIVAGQQATGAIAGMVPKWFLEGDAVHSETSFSNSGRGRMPSFEMEIRTMVVNGNRYSYDQMLNGSYKVYIPYYYQFGYELTSYARYKYGNDIWEKILHDVGTKPFTVIPFTLSLKKNMGLTKSRLQKEAFNFYDSIWFNQEEQIIPTGFHRINKRNGNVYTNYLYPVYTNDSTIVAVKSGLDQRAELISIDNKGKERRLFIPGNTNIQRIACAKNQVIWTEIIPDIRWPNRSYSVIKRFNMLNRKVITLTHKTRYFAPSIAEDGLKIVTAEISTNDLNSLIIIDARNGQELKKLASPNNYLLIQPVWLNNHTVAVITLDHSGKSIHSVDIESGQWTKLFEIGFTDISDLYGSFGYLFFRAAYSGIDNIYAFDLATSGLFLVTNAKNGAFNPTVSANGKKLLYSEYTSHGFDVVEADIVPEQWVEILKVTNHFNPIYERVSEEENPDNHFIHNSLAVFSIKPYREAFHLFNIHSWLPLYFNYNEMSIDNPPVFPGFSLLSQNILNTSLTTIGYEFRQGESYMHATYTFRGWFPVFQFSADYGGPVNFYKPQNNILNSHDYRLLQLSSEVYIPLNLTTDKMIRRVMPSLRLEYNNNFFYYNTDNLYRSGMEFITGRLLAYQYLMPSSRDIQPRFGQVLDIQYLTTPFENEQLGSILDTRLSFYLPGVLRHHTLLLSGYSEKQFVGTNTYRYSSRIGLARGYTAVSANEVYRISADYAFPIVYPDLRLTSLFYLKRIRANLFYDYAKAKSTSTTEFRSYGADILTDFHLVRAMFPFAGGVRFLYLENEAQWKTELIFNMNLNSF